MSATLLLVYFLRLKDSTSETRKNVFCFISKALFVLEIIRFQLSRYLLNVMTSSKPKHETRNIFYGITWEVNTVWTWNLPSLCNITKKKFIKKLYEKCGLGTSSRPFLISKEFSVKWNLRRPVCWFEEILIILLMHIWYT